MPVKNVTCCSVDVPMGCLPNAQCLVSSGDPWRKQLYVQLANNHVRSVLDVGKSYWRSRGNHKGSKRAGAGAIAGEGAGAVQEKGLILGWRAFE